MIKMPMPALLHAVEFLMDTVPLEQVQDMSVSLSYEPLSGKLEMRVDYEPSGTQQEVSRYGH